MEKALQLLSDDIPRVEAQLLEDLDSGVPLIRKVGEYVFASGGKRVRPLLLLLCARLSGYSGHRHIGLASVVEFIHTATLLHDDVVDGAVLRRGNSSANVLWGNEASVLVGDFLFAKSFSIMVRVGSLSILQILSDATTKMAEGEVLQLVSTADMEVAEERYLEVIRSKTAVLLSAACEVGGVLGEVDDARQEALREFGLDLGLAFQLMDDALDYVADQEEFGKSRGHDLEEGKITLPLIHPLRCCTDEERQSIAYVVEKDCLDPGDFALVFDLINRYDGIGHTRQRARDYVESAKARLSIFGDSQTRQALYELADYVVTRSK